MMTNDPEVRKQVLSLINKMIEPGRAVTKGDWRLAYDMVRRHAIRTTVWWKKQNITIEETPYE